MESTIPEAAGQESVLANGKQILMKAENDLSEFVHGGCSSYLVAIRALGALRLRRLTEPLRAATAGEALMRREAIL